MINDGILAKNSSSEALTDALLRALSSNLAAPGEAGKAHVRSKFSHVNVLGDYEMLFKSLMESEVATGNLQDNMTQDEFP